MSEVNIVAKAKRYGRWWLLKGLRQEVADETGYQQRLRKELEVLMQLQHPGVVTAIGLEEVESLGLCIVMEYVDGITLRWNAPNATSMDGGTRMSGARTSQYSMSFANSMYSMDNLVHSFTLDLNSRLTDNLSNQFLATYSKLDDVRGTNSSEFPFIDITRDENNYMALGYELFTWNNAVHNTICWRSMRRSPAVRMALRRLWRRF